MDAVTLMKDELRLIQSRIQYYERSMRISLSESIAYERLQAKEELLKELIAKCNIMNDKPHGIVQNIASQLSKDPSDDLPF